MTFFAKVQELEKQRVKVPEAFFAPGQALNFYIQYIKSKQQESGYNIPTYVCTYVRNYIHTLHYITLHYMTLHYITLHYITLHYITYTYVLYT